MAELRELDRLKSDFAAAASHELRTPLTTIRGYADLLKDRGPDDDPGTRDAIDAIVRQTGHLQRLVGNLLREAQLEHGGHETREESTSITDVLDGVRRGFPGSVDRIHVRAGPDIPSMLLDPVTLHEIVANLVDNALKYSTPGAPVEVAAEVEGNALVIRVRDEGEDPAGDLLGSSIGSRRSTDPRRGRTVVSGWGCTSSESSRGARAVRWRWTA